LFDPAQSAFSTLASMPAAREGHTATVLTNGKLLVTGGRSGTTTLATTALFNPASGPGSWATAGNMATARQGHTATLLADGRVLIAGGKNGTNTLSSAELFTSTTNTFAATSTMTGAVQGHTATLLANGMVLAAGGVNGTTTLSSAQLYDVTQGNACSSTSQCNSGFCVGGVCCNTSCTDQCTSCNLSGLAGVCSPKANGTSCTDGNACTLTDTCQAGTCAGGSPKTCTPLDACHVAGTCDSTSGICSNPVGPDKVGCNINLRVDGVVDAGDGTFFAVFGSNSSASTAFHPSSNVVSINGVPVALPQVPPPAYLATGQRPGTFLPTFHAGQTISWTVDGQTVSASQTSFQLTRISIGTSGFGVDIGGTVIVVKPDLDPYLAAPPTPGQAADPSTTYFDDSGLLKGELTVSPSGAAIYTLPITVAPGIGGMAPNLALVYSSQGGPGIAGQGWDLTGLSMVHRCALTRAEDGIASPVTMNGPAPSTDGLCLDGKRLHDTGPHPDGGRQYALEFQDFSDIRLSQAPIDPSPDAQMITVVTKSGETRYYGLTEFTRVELPGVWDANPPQGRTVGIWLLEKVVDVWGNFWEVHYNDDLGSTTASGMGATLKTHFETHGILPTQINYTGRLPGSASSDFADPVEPFQSIKFTYEARPDVRGGRLRSGFVPRSQRLKTIDTGLGVYTLEYKPPSSVPARDLMLPSLLEGIHYCPATGACTFPLSFGWLTDDYSWSPKPSYRLPVAIDGSVGAHFMDLDGDGLLDILQLKTNDPSTYDVTTHAWLNNGVDGFVSAPTRWFLPIELGVHGEFDTTPDNTVFADIDGDGLVDAMHIAAHADRRGCPNTSCAGKAQVNVRLNRLTTEGGWGGVSIEIPESADWVNSAIFGDNATMADMNGDGRADLVAMGAAGNQVHVLINTGAEEGGTATWEDAGGAYSGVTPVSDYELRDMNRDGLPDLVGKFGTDSAGKVYVQSGDPSWISSDHLAPASLPHSMEQFGDFDGDGFYDILQYGCRVTDSTDPPCSAEDSPTPTPVPFTRQIGYANGVGYEQASAGDPRAQFLVGFTPPTDDPDFPYRLEHWAFTTVDVNADGLADLVQRKLDPPFIESGINIAPGRLLLNTGSTFVTLNGADSYDDSIESNSIPAVPRQNRLTGDVNTTFIDLDGDGVTDLANMGTAWRNTFTPPRISAFTDGLATTDVNYTVITTKAAQTQGLTADHPRYANSGTTSPGSAFMTAPLRVVTQVVTPDGLGGLLTTDYEYRDLRASPVGRGPQGFRQVIVTGPEDKSQLTPTRIRTTTTYLQGFPYTGLPTDVNRDLVDATTLTTLASISTTHTDYCDGFPVLDECTSTEADPRFFARGYIPRFVRPVQVTDTTKLLSASDLTNGASGADKLQIVSAFMHDAKGNPIQTTVTTTNQGGYESYEKTVANTYGDPGSAEERLGKVTLSRVTNRRVTPVDCLSTPITHTTEFVYGEVNRFGLPVTGVMVGTLELQKTIVEPGAGVPLELATAYEYDRFGNVTKTTSCANAFDTCGQPGATGQPQLPYRITQVSYEPADFAASSGRHDPSAYGAGRFPVKTTNAAGHVEFTVYDPRFGKLQQRTDANGVSTCTEYDGIGRETYAIGRCGSTEIITQIKYLMGGLPSASLWFLKATIPPDGSPTWAYSDVHGRPTMTLTRGFDSQYVKTVQSYDNLGRVSQKTKPLLTNSADYSLEDGRVTTTQYDAIGRVVTVAEDLGVLDGTTAGSPAQSSTITTTYNGANGSGSITTSRLVNGVLRTHLEYKNALGKLASSFDPEGSEMLFTYDADGNMTDTAAPLIVCNPPADAASKFIHTTYDLRGRKRTSHDPDLGDWSYDYNGFGELVIQTDAKDQQTIMKYDVLGRMVERTDDSGTSQWIYDTSPHGIGKLAAMVSPSDPRLNGTCTLEFAPAPPSGQNQAGRSFHYTEFGQIEEVTDCADSTTFVTTYDYDSFGRTSLIQYPEVNGQRFGVNYTYTEAGYLHYLTDNADGKTIWAALAMNATGQVTHEVARNGVETESTHNDSTGWLLSRASVSHAHYFAENTIQEYAYAFDVAGNLLERTRTDSVVNADSTETFSYDDLDHLLSAEVQIPSQSYIASESYTYDTGGNIQTKAGKTYKYGTGCLAGARAAGPHALCQIDNGPTYTYDGNGNLTSVGDRTVSWNASNKARRITSGSGSTAQTADFIYGADGQRVVEALGKGSGPLGGSTNTTLARTVYVGLGPTGKSTYERTTRGTTVEHAHFIYAGSVHGGSALALRVITQDTSSPATPRSEYQFHHFDHLGSLTAVSNYRGHVLSPGEAGTAATIYGYDAWGARRSPDGRPADPSTFSTPTSNRGFTDQEAVPNVGLVNMNGRIYDPVVGRFLSPDPFVQVASDLQSYNRYGYALGNPLKYTDPSGYRSAFDQGFGAVLETYGGYGLFFAGMAICGASGGAACPIVFAIGTAVVSSTAAIAQGAPWAATIGTNVAGLGVGLMTGGLGGGVGEAVGGALGALLGGVVGGTASGVFMTAVSGGDLGQNILAGAAFGAVGAMFSLSASAARELSQEDAGAQLVQEGARQQTPGVGASPMPPAPSPGTIGPGEALADPKIKAELWRAWGESHPSATPSPRTHEQGGWIIERTSKLGRFFLGRYYVERWPGTGGTGSSIPVPKPPPGVRVVGSFHTHPNLGPGWVHSASPADWSIFGSGSAPHYIVSGPGVYRIGSGGQQFLGALGSTIAPPPSVGCSCSF